MGSAESTATLTANSLQIAGRRIRREAKRNTGGPEEAKEAITALMETPGVLETWATSCLNHDDNPEPGMAHIWHRFRFADIAAPYRKGAMEALATAYLASGQPVPEQEREEVHVEFGA